ncbi:hypothetical protein BDF21DRAFT_340600 [Thamnidium elegans]|nr:hypothetical protein BDF21DRAFT_340600 [Thamnidium elegans]
MLHYISTNNKICLVVLDHTGLTTDPSDLNIVKDTNNIEMIIVDNLPQSNRIRIFEKKKSFNTRRIQMQSTNNS